MRHITGIALLAAIASTSTRATADRIDDRLKELEAAAAPIVGRTAASIGETLSKAPDEVDALYRELERTIHRAGETRDARAVPLLDTIAESSAVLGITNPRSGASKRALIDAYVRVGAPEQGIAGTRERATTLTTESRERGAEICHQPSRPTERIVERSTRYFPPASLADSA